MSVGTPSARSIFLEALELHTPAEWSAHLDSACGEDRALRRQVEDLLRAHVESGGPLDRIENDGGRLRLDEFSTIVLGDFRIVREIGRGGMGVVYEAVQVSQEQRVALKLLTFAGLLDPRRRRRFELEARAAALVHHPNIVPIHAVGEFHGVPYYAMTLIEGLSVDEMIRAARADEMRDSSPVGSRSDSGTRRRLGADDSRRAATLARDAAEALDHAHAVGIIHRDVKPANLLVDDRGGLWIIDFGLAHILGDDRLSLTGDILGTPRYMSPEQVSPRRVVLDGRTDVYSLGATLYEMLTLRPAFDGDRADMLHRILREEPTPPGRLVRGLPRPLETIVLKAMAKSPAQRYSTAREFADDLGRFLQGTSIRARRPGMIDLGVKWTRRNRALAVTFVASVALALAISAANMIWTNGRLRANNRVLSAERATSKRLAIESDRNRKLAEQRLKTVGRHLRAFRLRQAAEAVKSRRFESAQEALRDISAAAGDASRPGFAWRMLWKSSRDEVAVLSEPNERVRSLAVSPDGRTIATGDQDGSIRLRDVDSGDVKTTLEGHGFPVVSLAFSNDGRMLASSAGEYATRRRGEVFLWDVVEGRRFASLDGFQRRHPNRVWFDQTDRRLWENSEPDGKPGYEFGAWEVPGAGASARPKLLGRWGAFDNIPITPDGRLFAAFDSEKQLSVRETDDDRVVWKAPFEARGYQIATLSPDGRYVAAAVEWMGRDPSLVVWEMESGREAYRGGELPAIVTQLEIDAENRYLTARNDVGMLFGKDLVGGGKWTIPKPAADDFTRAGGGFRPAPDGRALAWYYTGEITGAHPLTLLDPSDGREISRFPGRLERVRDVEFLPDGRAAAVRIDGAALLWKLRSVASPEPFRHDDEAWGVAFSSDGGRLATGGDDTEEPQTLKVWDLATGRLLRGWKAHDSTVAALAFQPNGRLLASTGLNATNNLKVWDAETGRLVFSLEGHTDKVRSVAFHPEGRILASTGRDGVIRLWDMSDGRLIRILTGHEDNIRQVVFSPDGRALASASTDRSVRLWDLDRGETVWSRRLPAPAAAVAFSPDGRSIACADEAGVVHRWDPIEDRTLEPFHVEDGELRCLCFEPGGETLAVATKSGKVHLWDTAAAQEILVIPAGDCQINGLAFSNDGSRLAATRHDGVVRVWNP